VCPRTKYENSYDRAFVRRARVHVDSGRCLRVYTLLRYVQCVCSSPQVLIYTRAHCYFFYFFILLSVRLRIIGFTRRSYTRTTCICARHSYRTSNLHWLLGVYTIFFHRRFFFHIYYIFYDIFGRYAQISTRSFSIR